MRLGAPGAERPVVRLDETTYADVPDEVRDFDEEFFGSGGLDRLGALVAERAGAGQVRAFTDERVGAPFAGPHGSQRQTVVGPR